MKLTWLIAREDYIKLIVFQPVMNFAEIYGTLNIITMFIRVRHLSLSPYKQIQSEFFDPVALRSILIFLTLLHLGLTSLPVSLRFSF